MKHNTCIATLLNGSLGALSFLLLTTLFYVAFNNLPAQSISQPRESIRVPKFGAKIDAQYQGDGLSVTPAANGAFLRCVFQKLEGLVTSEGLWLTSTAEPEAGEKFSVMAHAVGRDGTLKALPSQGTVGVVDKLAKLARSSLIEEYSVSVDGVRQDFVVTQRPAGDGELRVELYVAGAKAEAMVNGARLVLGGSGRNIAYNRLRVMDAEGRELKSRMEVTTETRLAVLVEDATATYPVRIDPTFSDADWISLGGIPGANNTVFATAVDGSGNLYIGGGFTAMGDVLAEHVAKWNGSTWSALGSGVSGQVNALAVSGNDLYVGGQFFTAGGIDAKNVAKWDGSWSAVGIGLDDQVSALAVSGNDLYVGGYFTTADLGATNVSRVAKWNGSTWSALGSGLNNVVSALAVSGTNLYVGGYFTMAGGSNANYVAKWNGTAWSALGSGTGGGFLPIVNALAVSGSDLYVGGNFLTAGGIDATNVAKWNGVSWSALGTGMGGGLSDSGVYALAVSGSDLYVGGDFITAGGASATNVAKWNGSTWSALSPGLRSPVASSFVRTLTVSGGNTYAGGSFTTAGTNGIFRVAKWNGNAWSALGNGLNNDVRAVAVSGNDLYVGGIFNAAGNVSANSVAKWNGSVWSALGSGLNRDVFALAVSGTNLYVGGNFTMAGGIGATNIAKWNGSAWSALGPGLNGTVLALALSDTNLYVGGLFNFTANFSTNVNNVAKWNGSTWSGLGSGVGSTVNALALSDGGVLPLYAGGNFLTAGGSNAVRVAKWDGIAWSALGSGVDNSVNALAVSSNNVYAGGTFTTAGGNSASRVAKWDGNAWSPLGDGADNTVNALAVLGSDVYVGGNFVYAGGNSALRVAKWDGIAWSALGSGIGSQFDSSRVYALTVSGTNLYVSGLFSTAGDKAAGYAVKANISFPIPPTPPTSPIIISISVDIGSVFLECLGTSNVVYDIERSDDDLGSFWNVIDTQQAAIDGSFFSTDYSPPAGSAFYRLHQQ